MRTLCLLLLAALLLPAPPAGAQITVIGDLSNDMQAQPGGTYTGSLLLKNETAEPQEAKIYQTDYLFYRDGTTLYGEAGSSPRSNARWITFAPAYAIIPAGQTATLDYTVRVPASLDGRPLTGTYWSMLMIEGIPRGSAESAAGRGAARGALGIEQRLRYGLQIATHIAGTGTRSFAFLDARLVKGTGKERTLEVDLENNGELGARPDVYAEVFDASGASKGRFPGAPFRMYPGTSVRQRIDLSALPAGDYRVLVVVDAGGEDALAAEYTISI